MIAKLFLYVYDDANELFNQWNEDFCGWVIKYSGRIRIHVVPTLNPMEW